MDPKYFSAAAALGAAMAQREWGLIYGGGKTGLMGTVARSVKAGGGRVVGVIPEFMKARELAFTEADELISVITMRERKLLMELLEILTLAHLETLQKPIIILNQEGYYDDLLRLFERIVAEKFMHATIRGKYAVAHTVEEIFPLLDGWSYQPGDAKWFNTR